MQTAVVHTGTALDTLVLVNYVSLLELAYDSVGRTILGAKMAPHAILLVNGVLKH